MTQKNRSAGEIASGENTGCDRYIPVAREKTYELIVAAQGGNMKARELLVKMNTGLVKKTAQRFLSPGYEYEDLLQLGYMGLVKAIDRFNVDFGVMFSTYAVPMIMGEIRRFLRDDGRIKMGRQLRSDARRIYKLQEEYYNETGRYPRISVLARKMDISEEQAVMLLEAGEVNAGIESLDNENSPASLKENVADTYRDTEEKLTDRINIRSSLDKLEDQEKKIIILRYYRDMTQSQTAKVVGISQVQVSRLEKKILTKLREAMEE